MKKSIALATILTALIIPVAAVASAKYPLIYRAKYCYTGVIATSGSYWQHQLTQYPDYYAKPAVNAKYLSQYGPATPYCPAS